MKRVLLVGVMGFCVCMIIRPIACPGHVASTNFILCVSGDDVSEVKKLLDKDPSLVHSRDLLGRSALVNALYWSTRRNNGKKDIIDLLIDRGADVNARSWTGQTELNDAISNVSPDGIAYIIDKGADVNARGRKGQTPLNMASAEMIRDQAAIITLLLEKGADVNDEDDFGQTALDWAQRYSRQQIVQLLLERGAKQGSHKRKK